MTQVSVDLACKTTKMIQWKRKRSEMHKTLQKCKVVVRVATEPKFSFARYRPLRLKNVRSKRKSDSRLM